MFWWVTVPSPMFGSHSDAIAPDEAVRVEVRVALGVGDDPARVGEQHRDVDEQREADETRRRSAPAATRARRGRAVRPDAHATARVRSPTPSSRGPLAPPVSLARAANEPEMVPPRRRSPGRGRRTGSRCPRAHDAPGTSVGELGGPRISSTSTSFAPGVEVLRRQRRPPRAPDPRSPPSASWPRSHR